MFGFKEQLQYGLAGERIFIDTYPELFTPYEGSNASDVLYKGVIPGEIKTDSYDMNKTPNFFMERYSVDFKRNSGGPWQALEKGSKFFIYHFEQQGLFFLFNDVSKLVERLEGLVNEHGLGVIKVPNKHYNTLGYKIRREWLEDLYIRPIQLGEPIE